MFFANSLVLFSLVLSATSLVTPNAIHNAHRRHALVPRNPVPVPEPLALAPQPVRRRSLSKRCKHRSPPAATTTTTTSHTPSETSSAAVGGHLNTGAPSHTDPPPSHTNPPPSHTPTPTTQESHTTTSSAPKSGLPSYMIGTQSGQGTFYATGLGACGITNNDSQHICAVSHLLYDSFPGYSSSNPNNNPVCGRQVEASFQGKSVVLTITDRCAECKVTDLDMSPSAFNSIADPSLGRIDISWRWL